MAPECGASRPVSRSSRSRRTQFDRRGDGRQHRLARSSSGTIGAKPSGYSSAMKPVESRPSRQRGWRISAARKGMLCWMPSMTKLSSASAIASMACGARRRPGAELGDHRIVEDRNLRALGDAGVVADDGVAGATLRRRPVARQPADRGQEVAERVFGIEPALDRPAVQPNVVLRDRQRLAGGDADHLLDQVDAGDEFGHRMLDLQPRVHLKEIEVPVASRR